MPPDTATTARAWVALGANLGDRLATLLSAVADLDADVPETRIVGASSIYETHPVGPSIESFLNAALELRTALPPETLLGHLHQIETAHARTRRVQWEARTLDLDLIAYLEPGAEQIEQFERGGVVQPHPRAHVRDFVLRPLIDAGMGLPLHDGRTPQQLLAELPPESLTIIESRPESLWTRSA